MWALLIVWLWLRRSGWGSDSDAGVTLPELYYSDLWQLDMSQTPTAQQQHTHSLTRPLSVAVRRSERLIGCTPLARHSLLQSDCAALLCGVRCMS